MCHHRHRTEISVACSPACFPFCLLPSLPVCLSPPPSLLLSIKENRLTSTLVSETASWEYEQYDQIPHDSCFPVVFKSILLASKSYSSHLFYVQYFPLTYIVKMLYPPLTLTMTRCFNGHGMAKLSMNHT